MAVLNTICGVSKMRGKLQHLPKIRQMASNKSTLTFQLYHGILRGVSLDIQNLLWSFKETDWIVSCLQYYGIFREFVAPQHMEQNKEKQESLFFRLLLSLFSGTFNRERYLALDLPPSLFFLPPFALLPFWFFLSG